MILIVQTDSDEIDLYCYIMMNPTTYITKYIECPGDIIDWIYPRLYFKCGVFNVETLEYITVEDIKVENSITNPQPKYKSEMTTYGSVIDYGDYCWHYYREDHIEIENKETKEITTLEHLGYNDFEEVEGCPLIRVQDDMYHKSGKKVCSSYAYEGDYLKNYGNLFAIVDKNDKVQIVDIEDDGKVNVEMDTPFAYSGYKTMVCYKIPPIKIKESLKGTLFEPIIDIVMRYY